MLRFATFVFVLLRILALGSPGAQGLDGAVPGPDVEGGPATNQLEYVLIVTGGELLSGAVQDAHTPYVTRALLPLGAVCVGAHLIDDLEEDLRGALAAATRRAPLVLVTGGLGPTLNDITRETVAGFTGIRLSEDPAVVEELARRLHTTADGVPDNIRRQARIPVRGGCLPNQRGTAVGLIFDATPAVVVALPGPPRELQPMVHDALAPWLQSRFGLRRPGPALTLRFVGLGQSRIDQVLREQVPLPVGVVVASQFEGGRVDFTFSLPKNGPEASVQLANLEAAVRLRLGANLYATGSTTLEMAAMERVRTNGGSLALVEAGSEGRLAASLARAPATRALLAGAFSAASEDQLRLMLQIPDAVWGVAGGGRLRLLAKHAREATAARWVLAVGEPFPAENGSPRVRAVLGLPGDRWEERLLELRDSAEAGRASLVNEVLDWVRRANVPAIPNEP